MIPWFPELTLPVPSGQSLNEFYQPSPLVGPLSIRNRPPTTLLDGRTRSLLRARRSLSLLLALET